MTELTLVPFLAVSRFIESTQDRLGVDSERHLVLNDDGLQQVDLLLLPLLILPFGLLA